MKKGDRVEIAPHYDLWMQGARYGTVLKILGDKALVEMDHPQVTAPKLFPIEYLTVKE